MYGCHSCPKMIKSNHYWPTTINVNIYRFYLCMGICIYVFMYVFTRNS